LIYTETLTGAQIYDLLAEQWLHKKDPEILGVSRGFTYVWDARRPDGASKVVPNSVRIDGRAVVPNGTYRIAVDAFLIGGGDAFDALPAGSAKLAGASDRDVLDAYVTAHSPLTPAPLDRITREN
jgi:5'-nucleotidase